MNVIALNILRKIKVAAPLTMGMLTFLVERIILSELFKVFTLQWILSVVVFYSIFTVLTGLGIYSYMFLIHKCQACNLAWTRIKVGKLKLASSYVRISLIKWLLYIEKIRAVETYECKNCHCIEHKKVKKIYFKGINSY